MSVVRPIQRVAYTRAEAAISLGMSLDSFERYVQPHVKVIREGKLRLVRVAELERWAVEREEHILNGNAHG